MSTQAEIDLEARIGDLERQLAEVAAKVNPLWAGGGDLLARSGYLRLGQEGTGVGEFSPLGLQFLASLLNDDVGFLAFVERFARSRSDLATIYPRWVLSANLDSAGNPKTVRAILHRASAQTAELAWQAGSATQGMGYFGPSFTMHGTLALPESLEDAGTLGEEISNGILTMAPYTVNYVTPESGSSDNLDTIAIPSNYQFTRGLILCIRTTGTNEITCRSDFGNLSLGGDIVVKASKPLWLWYDKANSVWLPMFPTGGSMKTSGGGYYLIPAGPAVGTGVSSSASANTYGSWTELRAASGNALYVVGIDVQPANDGGLDYIQIDIGTGGAGSETSVGESKLIVRLHTASSQWGTYRIEFPFPIPVAASTRIACRTADDVASGLSHVLTLHVIDQADLVSI